jgi:hypothetical protein
VLKIGFNLVFTAAIEAINSPLVIDFTRSIGFAGIGLLKKLEYLIGMPNIN